MILDGTYSAGEKLPAERVLAEEFAVSRPSLREAIQNLVAKGLVERRQGGGNFICNHQQSQINDPLFALIARNPESQFDLLEFRHSLEGMAAYYAALRGQIEDYQNLQRALNALPPMDEAKVEDMAEVLAEFYLVMAQASHNIVLLQVMRTMRELLQDNIAKNLALLRPYPDEWQKIAQQREEIVAAIIARNPEKARDASHAHLDFIEQTLITINQRSAKFDRTLRRIEVSERVAPNTQR